MKPYVSLLKVRFLNGLQYRAAALGGLVTQFFWGGMLVLIYRAFYGGSDIANGYAYKDLVSATWLQQAFLAFVMLYDWDSEMLDSIMTGSISYELTRPVDLYRLWYVKIISKRLAMAALRFAPIVIAAFFMPRPYNLSPPDSLPAFMLFIVTLFLGLILLGALSMLIYISVFKTMSPIGSMTAFSLLSEFFGGLTIPVPLMPAWLQNVCMALPYRCIGDLPFRVYTGHIGVSGAFFGIAAQLLWIAVLVAAGMYWMNRVTRLAAVQGG